MKHPQTTKRTSLPNYERHQRRLEHDLVTLNKTWAYCPRNDCFYNPWNAKAPVYKRVVIGGENRELVFRDEDAYHDHVLNGGVMR